MSKTTLAFVVEINGETLPKEEGLVYEIGQRILSNLTYCRDMEPDGSVPPGEIYVQEYNDYGRVLMTQGYGSGWKLEDLLEVVQMGLADKTRKLEEMEPKNGAIVTAIANNRQIIGLFQQARALQLNTMDVFALIAPDQGPHGTPRVGNKDYDVTTMGTLELTSRHPHTIRSNFLALREHAWQKGRLLELRLTPADRKGPNHDPHSHESYRVTPTSLLELADKVTIVLENGSYVNIKDKPGDDPRKR